MSIYTKLNDAREKFHKLELKKTGLNKFAGYNYFELGDFLIPALEIFKEVGLCAVVSFEKELATMKIVDTGTSGGNPETITITSPLSEANLKGCHPIQNVGACETYSRRYLWVAALEIVEHDALNATTGKKGDAPVTTPRGGIGDDLPDDVKQFLADSALYVTEQVQAGEVATAITYLKEQNLEADQKVWLFNQLDSKTRSAIKGTK